MVESTRRCAIFGLAAAAASLAAFTAGEPQDASAGAAGQAGPADPQASESETVVRYRERAASSDRPIDHYNYGTALLHDGQVGEAQAPLELSIGSDRDEVRESAFYNLGLSTALDGRFAQSDPSARRAALQAAREAFREVLRRRVDDEDARWNLELVERWLEEEGESGGDEQQGGQGQSPQGAGAGAAAAAGSGEMEMLSPEQAAALLEQAGDAEAAIRDRVMGRNRFQDPVVERNW
ncbi:MAG: hypothetical protein F4Z72_03110 [Gemmatimonadales bacterium]|uniref:hypothetical protein n=1 Tax=Candidatus Palauibacter irciniicola TaxID=3056733 RepID=UPI001385D93A|nr:hypothetical protein [Candidatus Palauibacter irciniicola]MYC19099.1 hypothetical protein [Gemmatimonadales bacterium]